MSVALFSCLQRQLCESKTHKRWRARSARGPHSKMQQEEQQLERHQLVYLPKNAPKRPAQWRHWACSGLRLWRLPSCFHSPLLSLCTHANMLNF